MRVASMSHSVLRRADVVSTCGAMDECTDYIPGASPTVVFRVPAVLLRRLDDFQRSQLIESRSETLRRILVERLGGEDWPPAA
jgi:hypothetical protein